MGERQRGHALRARGGVGEGVDAHALARLHLPEQPRVVGRDLGVLHVRHGGARGGEQRAVVVHERVVVGRRLGAHAREHRGVAIARRDVAPRAVLAERAERLARAGLGTAGPARLEEDGAADAEAVGLERGVAAVDLDAVDEPEGDARRIAVPATSSLRGTPARYTGSCAAVAPRTEAVEGAPTPPSR